MELFILLDGFYILDKIDENSIFNVTMRIFDSIKLKFDNKGYKNYFFSIDKRNFSYLKQLYDYSQNFMT